MRQIITFLLVASILVSLAGCSSDRTSADTEAVSDVTAAVTEAADIFEGMNVTDYGGREYRMLVRESYIEDIYTEEANGDVYNDAVYERNLMVEDRFNVEIKAIPTADSWDERDTYLNLVRGSVMAGSGDFDMIEVYAGISGYLMPDGVFSNLNEIENLRLDSPWWSKQLQEEMTVNGKLFTVTGDIAVSAWKSLHVFYFNKQLAENYQIESPYELVKSGKWTFDKLLDLIKDTSYDLNGDSKMTSEDRYGMLVFDSLSFANFGIGFGIPTTVRENDTRKLNLLSEEMLAASERLNAFVHENEDVLFMSEGDSDTNSVALFASNHALFFAGWLTHAEAMRDMDADFGILPYPKADEEQDGYYTNPRDFRSMISIPVDAPDTDFSGMITEALCVAGREIIIPAYYDRVLVGKVARDDESSEMLDIIRDGMMFDFGLEFGSQTEAAGFILRWTVKYNWSLPTYYASNESRYNAAFEEFMKVFD